MASRSGRTCAVCGRWPALREPVRTQVGLVVLRTVRKVDADLCREHGSKKARSFLLQTMLFGWWGLISLFANFGIIARDMAALRAYRRLEHPQGDGRSR